MVLLRAFGDVSKNQETVKSKEHVVALVSGGLDSTVLLYELHRHFVIDAAISFHYWARHNEREVPCAIHHCEHLKIDHRIILLDFFPSLFKSNLLIGGADIPNGHYEEKSMQATVVPFRNGVLMSIAAGFAESIGAVGVAIAAHTGDHAIYPDCREDFMSAMSDAIRLGTYAGIKIIRPFIGLSKTEIVQRGAVYGVDFSKTWSCYKGHELHCGTCGTCVERREAFIKAGVPDPTVYESTEPLPPRPF